VLYVTALIVGEERYAYGLRFEMDVTTNGDEHSFVSTSMKPLQIIGLEDSVESLRDFGDQLGKISGVSMRVVQDFVPDVDLDTVSERLDC
jgi:hypothetical protein